MMDNVKITERQFIVLVILYIIGQIGVDGALYQSLEFVGDGVQYLSMDSRLTICNMAIEAGAKNGIFAVDDITRAYVQNRFQREPVEYFSDADAEYVREESISNGNQYWICTMVYESDNTGWKISSFGH